jgi:hypothetical protein
MGTRLKSACSELLPMMQPMRRREAPPDDRVRTI